MVHVKTALTGAVLALALPGMALADGDAPNFGNCTVTGTAGSISLTTVEPDRLIVATMLPNPGWWNGTSPEATVDGFEYCLAAENAGRAGLKHMKLMNLAWDQVIGGAATGYDIAMASASATDKRGKVLQARASAARARDLGLTVFGLSLALMIGLFLVQMILFNDGKIQKTFLRRDLMTASASDVARAFLVNIKLALIAQALVLGLFLAVARLTPGTAGAPVRMMAIAYIDLFRPVPAVIVLDLIGFGLPLTGLPLISKVSSQCFAIIALTLTYSA